MRSSRYAIFMYGGMLGVPLLMFITLVALYYASPYAFSVLPALLVIALAVYAVTGVKEIFVHGHYTNSGNWIVAGAETQSGKMPSGRHGERVEVVVNRFNSLSKKFDSITYKFRATKFTTVLDALLSIKSYQDNTLSMRYNCRMGVCGSCAMVVNGKPVLACETNLLGSASSNTVEVTPMLGHPLTKDIVPDLNDFFERHKSVDPTLYRKNAGEKYAQGKEFKQSKEELDKYLPYSYCIMCGLCLDACPVVNSNPNFIGPQALAQSYRYYKDSRDQKGKRRLFDMDSWDGAWGCEFAGACSKACPKGVDPASAIQMLKGSLMKSIAQESE
jgi:succinate dehydrogenase / fumarate reductase iron-sulfur subunit